MMTKNVLLLLIVLLVIPSTLIHPFPTDNRLQGFLGCLSNLTSLTAPSSNSLFTPDEPSYYGALHSSIRNRRFETATTHQPMVLVQPSDVSEIGHVVVCARAHGFQLRVRSGGHDYEGMSYVSAALPFVVLDLQKLSAVTVDPAARTAWIQSGATIGEVYYHVGQSSSTLAFPAGVSPTVGVGGHFTGYGFLLWYAGLAADHVTDVVVVDVDGRIRDRRSIGEDVFWAIRGGGGNTFGIVAAWKVNLVTVPQAVTVGSVMKDTDGDATQCLLKWQQIADTLPDELFIRVVIFKAKNSAPTKLAVVFNIFYVGSSGQALPLLQERFPELGVAQEDLSEMGWAQSTVKVADFGDLSLENLLSRTPLEPKKYFKGKSDYVTRAIPQSGLEGIWGKMLREDIEEKYLILTPYGGTMSRIPETAIPFPHRKGTMFKIQYLVYWTQDGEEVSARHTGWMTDLYGYMTPYVSSNPRAAYVNYRDVDIGANNFGGGTTYERAQIWGAKYFKGNFNRLVAVKTAFDPTNFFCNEQSVPPRAGAGDNGGGSRHRKKNGARSGGHCWFCNIFFICIVVLWI